MADPFGRALRDEYHGTRDSPLLQRDGGESLEHPIHEFYFADFPDGEIQTWLESHVCGPLLDVGAGVGRHALHFQESHETVAIEISEQLVTVMCQRGVNDARLGDMFELPDQFGRGRFESGLLIGTQIGLTGSMAGLEEFLADLATVVTTGGTALVDSYDPTHPATSELLGYRDGPTPGLAHRVFWFEYEGQASAVLLFRLFSPNRMREAANETQWTVETIERSAEADSGYYVAKLGKE